MKIRLDVTCVSRGLFESREKAQGAIMAGLVLVNGSPEYKAGKSVKDSDVIEMLKSDCPYVSRGGLKLKGAIDAFKISVKDKICVDIGVATGGFTDCFLQEGAAKVYAVDVGEGQLHEKIRKDSKVIFIPQTNARFLRPDIFPEQPELGAIDVSFISLKLILGPVAGVMKSGSLIIALIKPQFELGPESLKKGIVKTEELRLSATATLRTFIADKVTDLKEIGLIDCPLKGAKGNTEFLWLLQKT